MSYLEKYIKLNLLLICCSATPQQDLLAQYHYDQYPIYLARKEAVCPTYCTPTLLPNGELWLGSYNAGLFRWENGRARHIPEPDTVPNQHRLIHPDKHGYAWFQMDDDWVGSISATGQIKYYQQHAGPWMYPQEPGVAVLRHNKKWENLQDSLFMPDTNKPWTYLGSVPHGSVLALQLGGRQPMVYTQPGASKLQLPNFFRQGASGEWSPLYFKNLTALMTPKTVIHAVLGPDLMVLAGMKGNLIVLVDHGKIVWKHQAELEWLENCYSDGVHFWIMENCGKNGPIRTFRLWEWAQDRFVPYTFRATNESRDIGSIAKDLAGNIWIGLENSLYRLFPAILSFEADNNIPNNIWSVVENRQGQVFFASYGDNLAILDHGNSVQVPALLRPFTHWMSGAGLINDQVWMSNAHSYGIARIDASLQADTILDGFIFYFLKQNQDKSIIAGSCGKGLFYLPTGKDARQFGNWRIIGKDKGLKLNNVLCVTADNFGRVWCIDRSDGIANYHPIADTAFTWNAPIKNKRPDFGGCTLETDTWGNIWFGTNKGLRFYRPSMEPFQPEKNLVPILSKLFDGAPIMAIKQKGPDTLIIASESRLYFLNLTYFYGHGAEKNLENAIQGSVFDATNSGLPGGAGQNGVCASTKGIFLAMGTTLNCWLPNQPPTAPEKQFLKIREIDFIDKNDVDTIQNPGSTVLFPINRRLVKFVLDSWSNLHYEPDSIRLIIDGRVKKTKAFSKGTLQDIDFRFDWPLFHNIEFQALRHGVVLTSTRIRVCVNIGWAEPFALSVLLLAIFGLYFLSKRARLKALMEKTNFDLASLQFQLLAFASQLEPHFLKNVLQPIQGRVFRIDPPLADSLTDLGNMSQILVDAGKQYPPGIHTLADEISLVRKYLWIQFRLFGKEKFTFELPDDATIAPFAAIKTPVMSLQLFVENAFIHGIEPMTQGGMIKLGMKDAGNFICVSIDDNGVGMEKSKRNERAKNATHTSRGLQLMRTLFNILNTKNAHKFDFKIIEKNKQGLGEGVRVLVYIPKSFQFEPTPNTILPTRD